jgi:hypothetical protein
MLEGLFGIIHKFGRNSFTHILKSYEHTLVSSEVKSLNYGKVNSTGTGVTTLIRRYIYFK